jgi:hypothetical protein
MSFSIFGPFIAITAGGLFNKLPVDLKGMRVVQKIFFT